MATRVIPGWRVAGPESPRPSETKSVAAGEAPGGLIETPASGFRASPGRRKNAPFPNKSVKENPPEGKPADAKAALAATRLNEKAEQKAQLAILRDVNGLAKLYPLNKEQRKNNPSNGGSNTIEAVANIDPKLIASRHPLYFNHEAIYLTTGNETSGRTHIQKRHLGSFPGIEAQPDPGSQFSEFGFQSPREVFEKIFYALKNNAEEVGVRANTKDGGGAPILLVKRDDGVQVAVVVVLATDGKLITAFPLAESNNPGQWTEFEGYMTRYKAHMKEYRQDVALHPGQVSRLAGTEPVQNW